MSRITAGLSILSDSITPDRITAILAFTPDRTVLKGADRDPPRTVPKSHGWYVSTETSNAAATEEVLVDLLDRLGALHSNLEELRRLSDDVVVIFRLAIVTKSGKVPLYFRSETIQRIAKFGADFDIDFFDCELQ